MFYQSTCRPARWGILRFVSVMCTDPYSIDSQYRLTTCRHQINTSWSAVELFRRSLILLRTILKKRSHRSRVPLMPQAQLSMSPSPGHCSETRMCSRLSRVTLCLITTFTLYVSMLSALTAAYRLRPLLDASMTESALVLPLWVC